MGVGISLILGALGATIRFALDPSSHVSGAVVNWNIVGDTLMVAGTLGAITSIVWIAVAARGGATHGRAGQ